MSQSRAAHHTDRARVAGVSLSHPARQVYSDLGMSKRELAEYYRDIAEHMLPSVEGRPLTIVRCPRGQGGQCFFQKHFDDTSLVGLEGVDVEESTGVGRYATAVGVAGLVQLVQLGALEIHSWLARSNRLDCPDQMILDLDPGIGVQWSRLRDAAREVRERLERRGLQSFLRTTGGKGLHVVVPLDAVHPWEEVRAVCARACRRDAVGYAGRVHRDRRQARPRRQDLRRLPAQLARRDRHCELFDAIEARGAGCGADRVGRARADHGSGSLPSCGYSPPCSAARAARLAGFREVQTAPYHWQFVTKKAARMRRT